jgi:hypothetical protein
VLGTAVRPGPGLDQLCELPQEKYAIRRRSSIDHSCSYVMRLESEDEVGVGQHASCKHDRRMGLEIDPEPSPRVDCVIECESAAYVERAERPRPGIETLRVSPVERLGERASSAVPSADEDDFERAVLGRTAHTAALSRRTSGRGRPIGEEGRPRRLVSWNPVFGEGEVDEDGCQDRTGGFIFRDAHYVHAARPITV